MTLSGGPNEFDCIECGRHILRWGPPDDPVCAECLHLPGWFRNPEIAAMLDPEFVVEKESE